MQEDDIELKNHLNKMYEILNPTINTFVKYNLIQNNDDILVKYQNIYWLGIISKDYLTQQYKFEIYNPNCDNVNIINYYNKNNKFTWYDIIIKHNNNISSLADLRIQLRERYLKETFEVLESLLKYECCCSFIYGDGQNTILLEVKNKDMESFLKKFPYLLQLKFIKIEEFKEVILDDLKEPLRKINQKNSRLCCCIKNIFQ